MRSCAALRSSVSVAASEFKGDRLVRYTRGMIEIFDRASLERQACECYDSDRAWGQLSNTCN